MKTTEEKIVNRCIHFNGVHRKKCSAGIEYSNFQLGGSWPCFKNKQEESPFKCEFAKFLTQEEARKEAELMQQQFQKHFKAMRSAHDDAKNKGLAKGHGGNSKCKCPCCEEGYIWYSVASCNGHMWATCSTKNCVHWIE